MANQYQNPVTPEELQQIRELHAQGKGRNEIARTIGRSLRTVSVYAAKMDLSFDRTMTEEATRARKADLEERRVILAEALQGDAERLSSQMWEPAKVFNIGGKDNTYTEHDVDEPPADAKKSLMAAAGIAVEKSLKLVPPEVDEANVEAARSMLGSLADGLSRLAAQEPRGEDDSGEG
ncbi:helix-turn-helix domain-containing protein [Streptomyces sp. NPDC003730]